MEPRSLAATFALERPLDSGILTAMSDAPIDDALQREVRAALRAGRPAHEILTMLMSNGLRESEARALLDGARAEDTAAPAAPAPTSPGFPLPAMAGLGLVVIGIALFAGEGRTSIWLFVFGGAGIAAGLAQIAGGRS